MVRLVLKPQPLQRLGPLLECLLQGMIAERLFRAPGEKVGAVAKLPVPACCDLQHQGAQSAQDIKENRS